jgi:hypothetical protein
MGETEMIAFFAGVFIGTMLGMLVCSLCIASRDEEVKHSGSDMRKDGG